MQTRFAERRLRIFRSCPLLLDELQGYHRRGGQLVKQNDDLTCALRHGLMSLRHARRGPLGGAAHPRSSWKVTYAEPGDFDIFNPARRSDGSPHRPPREIAREWIGSVPPIPDWLR